MRLDVAMTDTVSVNVRQGAEQLIHIELHEGGGGRGEGGREGGREEGGRREGERREEQRRGMMG